MMEIKDEREERYEQFKKTHMEKLEKFEVRESKLLKDIYKSDKGVDIGEWYSSLIDVTLNSIIELKAYPIRIEKELIKGGIRIKPSIKQILNEFVKVKSPEEIKPKLSYIA